MLYLKDNTEARANTIVVYEVGENKEIYRITSSFSERSDCVSVVDSDDVKTCIKVKTLRRAKKNERAKFQYKRKVLTCAKQLVIEYANNKHQSRIYACCLCNEFYAKNCIKCPNRVFSTSIDIHLACLSRMSYHFSNAPSYRSEETQKLSSTFWQLAYEYLKKISVFSFTEDLFKEEKVIIELKNIDLKASKETAIRLKCYIFSTR